MVIILLSIPPERKTPIGTSDISLSATDFESASSRETKEFSNEFNFGKNEADIVNDMTKEAHAMLDLAGFKSIVASQTIPVGGSSIHEMGTARMGRDPQTSVLNGFNQSHDIPNLFVTDGSCMASSSHIHPSLTYMALTVRACDYAAIQLKTSYY